MDNNVLEDLKKENERLIKLNERLLAENKKLYEDLKLLEDTVNQYLDDEQDNDGYTLLEENTEDDSGEETNYFNEILHVLPFYL